MRGSSLKVGLMGLSMAFGVSASQSMAIRVTGNRVGPAHNEFAWESAPTQMSLAPVEMEDAFTIGVVNADQGAQYAIRRHFAAFRDDSDEGEVIAEAGTVAEQWVPFDGTFKAPSEWLSEDPKGQTLKALEARVAAKAPGKRAHYYPQYVEIRVVTRTGRKRSVKIGIHLGC